MKKILKNTLFIILVIFILTGCTNKNKDESKQSDKINEEINYIEDNIFNIVNKYAKGEYLKNNAIDWDSILKDEKKINDSLDSILMDFSQVNIDKNDLAQFSNKLDNLLILTSDKKEIEVINELSNIYSLLPNFMEKYVDNKSEINKKKLKALILSSYVISNSKSWVDAKVSIQNVENKYAEMMNDVNYIKENSYNLNKVYVLIQELKSAINLENINLVNLKYISLIEKL